ncbi:hypothetical protein EKO23_03345 [Nocardioides guangzhouensis]|uniref:Acyl carrier protein n=1 Tax=Nocardioides guangzhouensis TaxID=2497878 RepID=A0A4Q4ZJA8_9ACTN|nr:hypothetical protein [Nocardioides guangzhouensis]RYP88377.1 hypothetical protein EKO23_03345 [Nocardioides guangzhouensis]
MCVTQQLDRESVLAVTRLELLVAAPDVAEDVPTDVPLARAADSGALHSLFDRLEYRYAISVPADVRRSLRTLDDIAAYVVARAHAVWGGR